MDGAIDQRVNIGQIARMAGVQTSTIRYYESLGLLDPPPRASGWRRYDPGILHRLRAIRTARDLGFTLEQIHILLDGFPEGTPPPDRWRTMAEVKLAEIDEIISRITSMKRLLEAGLDCVCMSVETCFGDGDMFCEPAGVIESDEGCASSGWSG